MWCVSPTFITRTSLLLKCCRSAGELIAARHCSPRPPSTTNPPPPPPPPFFLINPCPCLACLFLSKIVSQAGRTGRQRKRDNMDRKGWEQQPRWTGSGVHCLVLLIRGGRGVRAGRRLRGVMGRPRSRGLEGVRWRNWPDECLDPTGRHQEGFQLLSNGIPRTSFERKKRSGQNKTE